MTANATIFSPDLIPQAPDDPHYGLRATYKSDPCDRKVDLIIGVYRDNEGRPWTLPVVKKVKIYCHSLPHRHLSPFLDADKSDSLGRTALLQ